MNKVQEKVVLEAISGQVARYKEAEQNLQKSEGEVRRWTQSMEEIKGHIDDLKEGLQ